MMRNAHVTICVLVLVGCDAASRPASRGADEDLAGSVDSVVDHHESTAADSLRLALDELLSGSRQRDPGAQTWFTSETAGALRYVAVASTGHATVDFSDLRTIIPNASSSAGSAILLDELNSTVFSIPQVQSVTYQIEGSCERFWEWLQYSCQVVYRP